MSNRKEEMYENAMEVVYDRVDKVTWLLEEVMVLINSMEAVSHRDKSRLADIEKKTDKMFVVLESIKY